MLQTENNRNDKKQAPLLSLNVIKLALLTHKLQTLFNTNQEVQYLLISIFFQAAFDTTKVKISHEKDRSIKRINCLPEIPYM